MRITFLITIKCHNGSTFIQLPTNQQMMQIFNISVPDKPLTNMELVRYARLLEIPDFRGVFMRDMLPLHLFRVECGIVNFNTSNQPGSHWMVIVKILFKPKKGFVLPRHCFTRPYNPLHLQLDEAYNDVDAISICHEICYRDNPSGKHECDHKMLAELNTLEPKGRREKVNRQLV